ncbi:MAG: hypothetical protein V3U71_06870 [Cocleimonas sp.]
MKGFLFIFVSISLLLSGCDSKKEKLNQQRPWDVSTTADGSTSVLDVEIGKTTFKQLMFKLHLLAEPGLFEAPDGTLSLEAYFGKKKFGILEARLVAEMDADEKILKKMLDEQAGKDSTPSNHWKYKLTVENTKIANDLRVWRLIYLPISNYEPKQMNFFGKPEETMKINDTAEYRLYPSRGMALLYDTNGKEIFYYAAQKDFERLKNSLPRETVIQIR